MSNVNQVESSAYLPILKSIYYVTWILLFMIIAELLSYQFDSEFKYWIYKYIELLQLFRSKSENWKRKLQTEDRRQMISIFVHFR